MDERLDEQLIFNGINAETGDYFFPALTPRQASQAVLHGIAGASEQATLNWRAARAKGHLGVMEGIDPKNLLESGWAVIIGEGVPPEHVEALQPLFDLRKEQAGDRYQVYSTKDGTHWKAGQSKSDWLIERKAGAGGLVNPAKVPYYVLLVGSPEQIPFEFQYQLDVQYAVGRIHFETAQDYANYASSVVAAEKGAVSLARRAAFWGPRREDDKPTKLSSSLLVKPMHEWAAGLNNGWSADFYEPERSTRAQALDLLGGKDTPAFLLTASHGACRFMDTAGQLEQMGALVCQDWPGKGKGKEFRDCIVAGEDIPADARLAGLIAMTFACFGGGTPAMNEFPMEGWPAQWSAKPFLAALPKRMLSHPKGGALAVIGHIDQAWDLSFRWPASAPQLETFQSTVQRLMDGHPVGSAMEPFNSRYAELSSDIVPLVKKADAGKELSSRELLIMSSQKDSRNYAVMGDPAVRIPVGVEPKASREVVVVNTVAASKAVAAESPASAGTLNVTSSAPGVHTVSVTNAPGAIHTTIPMQNGRVDVELWRAHVAAVERAIAERS